MPELPEVEAARLVLEDAAVNKRIVKVRAANDPLVFGGISPRAIAKSLTGRRVIAVSRRGKYFWCELDRRPWPLFHFGMSGSLHVLDPAQARRTPAHSHVKLQLWLDDGSSVLWRDPRRFGRIGLRQDPLSEPPLSRLGGDALLAPPKRLAEGLGRTTRNIKAVLLDQRMFPGVGNWIADEVLYQARIAPARPAASLTGAEIARLRGCLRRVLSRAIAVRADSDRFPRTWLFHHRWRDGGRTARGEIIVRETIAGRTTAWVPAVQR